MGSLWKFWKKNCYLGDMTQGCESDRVITMIRNGWCKFRDLVSLSASNGLPLGARGRLYSTCVYTVMLYGSETWPVEEEDLIWLEMNDTRMVRWMCNIRHEDRISSEKFRTRLKLKNIKEFLQNKRLQCFGNL